MSVEGDNDQGRTESASVGSSGGWRKTPLWLRCILILIGFVGFGYLSMIVVGLGTILVSTSCVFCSREYVASPECFSSDLSIDADGMLEWELRQSEVPFRRVERGFMAPPRISDGFRNNNYSDAVWVEMKVADALIAVALQDGVTLNGFVHRDPDILRAVMLRHTQTGQKRWDCSERNLVLEARYWRIATPEDVARAGIVASAKDVASIVTQASLQTKAALERSIFPFLDGARNWTRSVPNDAYWLRFSDELTPHSVSFTVTHGEDVRVEKGGTVLAEGRVTVVSQVKGTIRRVGDPLYKVHFIGDASHRVLYEPLPGSPLGPWEASRARAGTAADAWTNRIESKASIVVRSDNPDGPIRYIMSNISHDWTPKRGNP